MLFYPYLSPVSCSIVAAVADGLKAWALLKKKPYNFDLVLTEVVMPSISGIGLLSKIMNNNICKSIPVISKLKMWNC